MSSTPTRLRAAVVGTGGIVTGSHLPALRAHSGRIELRAAVDPARLDAFRTRARASGMDVEGYAGLAATWSSSAPRRRCTQIVAALTAGVWVLCEKPLCLPLAEYDEIAAAEEASGTYASVVFQHRYGSGAVHARQGPWLAFTAEHGDVDAHSTLVFAHALEHLDAVHASHWFVRSEPIPTVAFSWAFFEEFELAPGACFAYRYRDRVSTHLKGLTW